MDRLFHFSLRSRYTAMLAALRTLIQTRHGLDHTVVETIPYAPSGKHALR
jgi:hypothetical protein